MLQKGLLFELKKVYDQQAIHFYLNGIHNSVKASVFWGTYYSAASFFFLVVFLTAFALRASSSASS